MTKENDVPIDQEMYLDARSRVDNWIENINFIGKVGDVDPKDLLTIFKFHGARDIDAEQVSELSKHKLTEVRKGLEAFFGNDRLDQFEVLMAEFTLNYNKFEGNRRLPMAIESFSGETGLGNRRLLLELAQLANGIISLDYFRERTEAALMNGILWQERKDNERISLPDPDSIGGKIKKVNQIAPGFTAELYAWITKTQI